MQIPMGAWHTIEVKDGVRYMRRRMGSISREEGNVLLGWMRVLAVLFYNIVVSIRVI